MPFPLRFLEVIVFCGLLLQPQQMNFEPHSVLAKSNRTEALMKELSAQGVTSERVLGVDPSGVPLLCGNEGSLLPAKATTALRTEAGPLPAGTRAWECIPCVIRFDGVESFRLEVNANSPVSAVRLTCPPNLIPASGGTEQSLRNDGLGEDRMAGDLIYTSVTMVPDTNWGMAEFFGRDTNSPAGLDFFDIGSLKIVEITGETNEFLIWPQVGILSPNIPFRAATMLSSNVLVSAHMINVRSAEQVSQRSLRQVSAEEIHPFGREIYSAVPDVFDFLTFFSTDHIEWLPRTTLANFYAGLHWSVQINFTGTGQQPFNNSADVGSQGRLLGLNFLDTNHRGAYSANVTHEILHQWLVFTYSLGLTYDGPHYDFRSSAASLLGAYQWLPSGTNGVFIMNCEEGRSGAHFAPPLDKYMMGLIEATNVPPIRFYRSDLPPPLNLCDQPLYTDHLVTIDQIQEVHGVRTRPASAQKDFNIGFVAESRDRLFNPTEVTFYDILAEHYTKPFPSDGPPPYVGYTWAPVTRFFGEGTTWRSDVLSLALPSFTSILGNAPGNIQLSGKGVPSRVYGLQTSSNLVNWTTIGTVLTGTNGTFQILDATGSRQKFYRLVWP